MSKDTDTSPTEILNFWFPDGTNPDLETHTKLWQWRMQGGANDEIIRHYTSLTHCAAAGELEGWKANPKARLALIILLDQFSRTVWAGSPKAYAQDPKALELCLEGLKNGHFDQLGTGWYKTVFKLPLEHCECSDHLANLEKAIIIADQVLEEAPEHLKKFYQFAAGQPRKHRAVIAKFGRHSHRNQVLGRTSTVEELEYVNKGEFPHQVDMISAIK